MRHVPISSERAIAINNLGYEARYFAHRHRLTRAVAERLIAEIGPDRAKLDAAALAYKRLPDEV
jgi:hypothetical protein